jgi:hypothetical protein
MVQSHILSVPLAVEYGTNESLFLSNICWWIEKNRANDRHFHEGRYWTYNSVAGFTELFPYFTAHQIQYLIGKLRKDSILLVGNFNKIGYDRTNWYSVSEEVMNIYLGKTREEAGVPASPPETGPEEEPAPAAETSPLEQEETPCPASEPAPPEPEDPPILPNGKMHSGNFMNPFYQTGKWIHEKSVIDSGISHDRFGKFHEPIPAIKPVNKPAAAALDEKPRSAAGPPETAAAALKKTLIKINPGLVFDDPFYSKAAVFLPDERYPVWLYEECLAKNPASLRGLYYSLFFKPDILALFQETRKKTRDPPPPQLNIVCPVCGREHEQKESCPECGLTQEDRTNGETIAKQKRLYALSPEDRKAYEEALHRIASDFNAQTASNPGLIQKLLQEKHDLEEKYGLLPQSGAG